MAVAKKEKKKAIKSALVAGTQQTLSKIFRDFQYLWSNHRHLSIFIVGITDS
jgi:hypothetical protein